MNITQKNYISVGDVQQLIERLEGFHNLPEKGFFLGLADYIQFIDNNPHFEEIIKSIKAIEATDEENLNQIENKLLHDIQLAEPKIFSLLKEKQYDFSELHKEIQNFEGVKNGTIQSTATWAEALYGGLAGIVRSLVEKGYVKDVAGFVEIFPDTGRIKRFLISQIYDSYLIELERFRNLRKTRIWGSWDKVVVAYLVIHKFDEEIKKLDPHKKIWLHLNFIGLRGEMMDIIDQKQKHRIEFNLDDYRSNAQRVHDYFLEHSGGVDLLEAMEGFQKHAVNQIQSPATEISAAFVNDFNQQIAKAQSVLEGFQQMGTAVVEPLQQLGSITQNLIKSTDTLGSAITSLPPVSYSPPITNFDLQNKQLTSTQNIEEKVTEIAAVIVPKATELGYIKHPTRKEMGKITTLIKKKRALGKKQTRLFELLSDFEKHETKSLANNVPTDDLKHLKEALNNKIKLDGFVVDSDLGGGFRPSYYQLRQLTNRENSLQKTEAN